MAKPLDPQPWRHTLGERANWETVNDGLHWVFAPRAGYAQLIEDYD